MRRLMVLLVAALMWAALAAAPALADLTFGIIAFRPIPPPAGLGAGGCFSTGSCFFFFNFTRTVPLRAGGRQVVLSGPIECKAGLSVTLRLTVTQRSTGAIAQLGLRGPCPTKLRGFRATITSRTQPLVAGDAFACVLGLVQRGETYVDANQSCGPVKLVATS